MNYDTVKKLNSLTDTLLDFKQRIEFLESHLKNAPETKLGYVSAIENRLETLKENDIKLKFELSTLVTDFAQQLYEEDEF